MKFLSIVAFVLSVIGVCLQGIICIDYILSSETPLWKSVIIVALLLWAVLLVLLLGVCVKKMCLR